MLLGNVTRITWITAMTQSGLVPELVGRFRLGGQILLCINNSKSVHFRVVNRGQERGDRGEGRFGVRTVLFNVNVNDKHASFATFQLRCTVHAYFVAKM